MQRKSDILFSKIQESEIRKYPRLGCCMKDGILYPTAYAESNFKMAVLLKEPYAEWDEELNMPSECDYDFFDIIQNLKYHYNNGLNRTWIKVAAIAYSLNNKTPYTENLSYNQVVEGLSCVSWINLSKTPWKTTTKMDEAFFDRVNIWEPVVRAQLAECNPDIVFYGNTWDSSWVNPIEPDLEWAGENCTNTRKYCYKSKGGNKYTIYISQYKETGKLLVNGYHPEFGNSSCWQTGFIQNYMNMYGL